MEQPLPVCPRCAYDLSGTVATWREACPLEGVCSECGVGFRWREVLRAHELEQRGFVEHARGAWRRFAWAWRTLGWTIWPARFWGKVGLRFPPRARGMAVWVAVVIAAPHVAAAAVLTVLESYFRWRAASLDSDLVLSELFPMLFRHDRWSPVGELQLARWHPFAAGAAAAGVVFPVILLALADTRRMAKVRRGHVARAAVYGLAWLAVFVGFRAAAALLEGIGLATFEATGRGLGAARFAREVRQEVRGLWMPLAALAVGWVFLWWWFAVRTLLVGHRPERVYALCAVGAGLGAASALLLTREAAWLLRDWFV